MMLFKKKNDDVPTRIVDDNEAMVGDFTRRTNYWSYRAWPYQFEERFANFMTVLDGHLKELFKADIDSGNGNVLDNLIYDAMAYAKMDLQKQRTNHHDIINSLSLKFKSDRQAFQDKKQMKEVDANEVREELKALKQRLKKKNEVTYHE